MENESWQAIIDYIRMVLLIVSDSIDNESVQIINYYLAHDEYEMSFEILFIEIMLLKQPPGIDFLTALDIGKKIRLDQESIFDSNFWNKFEKYVASQKI